MTSTNRTGPHATFFSRMSATPQGITLAIFESIALAFFTGYLLRYYGMKGSPTYALVFVYVSWYLGFFGTMFLPIDIAEAYAARLWTLKNITAGDSALDSTNGTYPLPTLNFTQTFSLSPSITPASLFKTVTVSSTRSPTATPTYAQTPSMTPSPSGTPSGSPSPTVTRVAPAPGATVTPSRTPISTPSTSPSPTTSKSPKNPLPSQPSSPRGRTRATATAPPPPWTWTT